jgi:hypothetical protein
MNKAARLSIYDAIIEVTRRCNMKCAHCLRGKAMSLDIFPKDIDELMKRIRHISNLTFTGGEPSLNTAAIRYALEAAKRQGVDVSSFYIVTNGKKITPEFVLSTLEWYDYCDDKEMCAVEMSRDAYHERIALPTLLDGLKYFRERDQWDGNLSRQGRSKSEDTAREVRPEKYVIDDYRVDEGDIYLNADGQIIAGCDWSFANQKKHVVCDVRDLSIEALEKYNERIQP